MKKILFLVSAIILINTIQAQNKKAYQLYNKASEITDFATMITETAKADIILFGELHDNPIAHWLQLELTKAVYEIKDGNITLGAEMFESDNQLVINEYLNAFYETDKFEKDCRLWPNYTTDYKPLMEFAKSNKLPFIATNIPRRYASMVFKNGFEALEKLSDEAKAYLPPLPIQYDAELPAYKSMMQMGGSPMHANDNFPKAQAIKDATMAYFILKYFQEGNCFIHYHGAYHSDNYQGIYWYLQQERPQLKVVTISTVLQKDTETLSTENQAIADFIIVVPESMTRSY